MPPSLFTSSTYYHDDEELVPLIDRSEALHAAAVRRKVKVVKELLRRGADVNRKDGNSKTAAELMIKEYLTEEEECYERGL